MSIHLAEADILNMISLPFHTFAWFLLHMEYVPNKHGTCPRKSYLFIYPVLLTSKDSLRIQLFRKTCSTNSAQFCCSRPGVDSRKARYGVILWSTRRPFGLFSGKFQNSTLYDELHKHTLTGWATCVPTMPLMQGAIPWSSSSHYGLHAWLYLTKACRVWNRPFAGPGHVTSPLPPSPLNLRPGTFWVPEMKRAGKHK